MPVAKVMSVAVNDIAKTEFLRYGIFPAFIKHPDTSKQSAHPQGSTFEKTVSKDGLLCIARTGGVIYA